MAYPPADELIVERLNEKNEIIFIEKIQELIEKSKDRNRDWFPLILQRYNTHYEQWYLTFHKNELISFCAVQNFNGFYRLNTRQWNGIKKTGLERGVIYNEISPAMLMLKLEFEDFPKNQFFSMEYINRRPLLKNFAIKVNKWYNKKFKLQEGMFMTVPNWPNLENEAWCWQNIISEITIPLKKINISEYQKRFSNIRKNKL